MANRHKLVDKSYEFGHLVLSNDGHIDLPTLRPPAHPCTARTHGGGIDRGRGAGSWSLTNICSTIRAHYERALRLGATPAQRAFELANLGVSGGASLLEKVDNRPLEVLGDYVAYPCIDPLVEKDHGCDQRTKYPLSNQWNPLKG